MTNCWACASRRCISDVRQDSFSNFSYAQIQLVSLAFRMQTDTWHVPINVELGKRRMSVPRELVFLRVFTVRVCAPVAHLLRTVKRSGLFFLAARITASNIKHSYANVLHLRATTSKHALLRDFAFNLRSCASLNYPCYIPLFLYKWDRIDKSDIHKPIMRSIQLMS